MHVKVIEELEAAREALKEKREGIIKDMNEQVLVTLTYGPAHALALCFRKRLCER